MNKRMKNPSSVLGALALLSFGCAGATAPQAEHTDAKTAISAAEAEGAQDVPQASLYLKMARDGVADAEALMAEKKYEDAQPVLERARMDAELASSLTRQAEIKDEAEAEIERVKSLQESNNRLRHSSAG
jgi:hypothetical protein